jgi:hypothetical protein
MNNTEQAEQLILAAELIKTGHPLEWQQRDGKWYKCSSDEVLNFLTQGFPIRPILATPPDGRPLHNPDNLTVEQVGLGYRLALIDEKTNENEALQEFWNKGEWMTSGRVYSDTFGEAPNHRITYRLPLSVPWPEVKADPYAELKAAHAAGKAIEVQMPSGEWFDYNPDKPQWNLQPECYRIKPEPPPFQLPPPPPGMRWHRRTTRPLVFTYEGQEWTYHRPGDPMPCDGERIVCILMGIGAQAAHHAKSLCWTLLGQGSDSDIIGWRYAETTKQVELGPEDVPPLSVIRRKGEKQNWHWRLISYVHGTHAICADRAYEWSELERDYEINRSISLTGKWDANAWEPCSKEVQA